MTDDHLPECLMWDVRVCMCICLELRACEKRMLKEGYLTGYAAAMEDGWGEPGHIKAALDEAVQRVEALPHSLECVTRDANYSRPCNCLRGDALDAIKGDQR